MLKEAFLITSEELFSKTWLKIALLKNFFQNWGRRLPQLLRSRLNLVEEGNKKYLVALCGLFLATPIT